MRPLVTCALAATLAACGGAGTRAASAPAASSSAASAPAAPAPPLPDHAIARSAVRAVLARGLGAFLQRVELDDEPVFNGGRFHGFRIAALRDPAFWAGVDLKPGDVVVTVNGMPIERPEQAVAAFDSLQTAPELRVAYERQGHALALVYSIVDGR